MYHGSLTVCVVCLSVYLMYNVSLSECLYNYTICVCVSVCVMYQVGLYECLCNVPWKSV